MNNAKKRNGINLNMTATIRIIDAVTAADMKALCETLFKILSKPTSRKDGETMRRNLRHAIRWPGNSRRV
jgi:hypothetical protein